MGAVRDRSSHGRRSRKGLRVQQRDVELLAYIFLKETGQDIDSYGEKYLFAPLGIKHYWKRDYVGTVDTEGGVYLNSEDLAKLGFLFLNNGVWERKQIVSEKWVKQSVASHAPSPWTVEQSVPPYSVAGEGVYYGFLWWLYPRSGKFAWMGFGWGGQSVMVLPCAACRIKENQVVSGRQSGSRARSNCSTGLYIST